MRHLKARINLFLLMVISHSCMSQQDFDTKLESLLDKSVPFIEATKLKSVLDDKKIYLLDTRSAEEFAVSHLTGAIRVGYRDFGSGKVFNIPREAPVVVYCSVGYRSEKVGEQLLQMGFRNVQNLYGGIFKWKNEGNSVVDSHGAITDSVHTYNKKWSRWLTNGVKVYE